MSQNGITRKQFFGMIGAAVVATASPALPVRIEGLLDNRQFQLEEIARIFAVSPHLLVGGVDLAWERDRTVFTRATLGAIVRGPFTVESV